MKTSLKNNIKPLVRIYINHFPIKINDYWLFVNPNNVEIVPPTIMGKYEKEATLFFKKIIRPGWVIVDIGAYIGYFSIHFATLTGRSGRVLAFEPNPQNNKILRRNLTFRNIANVKVFNYALSNKEEASKIYMGA